LKNAHFRKIVEQPVTKLVNGVGLVKCQILIAQSEPPVRLIETPVRMSGHVTECWIDAENSDTFRLSPGRSTGMDLRVESAFAWTPLSTAIGCPATPRFAAGGTGRSTVRVALKTSAERIALWRCLWSREFTRPDFQAGNFGTHFIRRSWAEPAAGSRHEQLAMVMSA
jgi:acetyl/propionyl-CoA carboxylase alpha subunit